MNRRALFRQHFFQYINKAEFTIALSSVFGTIASTILFGYSSYLSDRNDRIRRINKTPLNHIYVDYISYEDYVKMIDKRNWKPVAERIEKEKQETIKQQNEKTFQYKKDELINSINTWLVNKTKKQQQQNNMEVDNKSLMELAKFNNINTDNINNNFQSNVQKAEIKEDENIKVDNQENIQVRANNSKIAELSNKSNILPPGKKKKQEGTKYFIVKEPGSILSYDPADYRRKHIKQDIRLKKDRQKVGVIGGQEISKDESIFVSIFNIWKALIYKVEPNKKEHVVINSNYDQYGRRIRRDSVVSKNISHGTKKANNNINEEEKEEKKEVENEMVFLEPTFKIDGKVSKISNNPETQKLIIDEVITKESLEVLIYLEYEIETCWYNEFYKNGYTHIPSTFSVDYDKNGNVKSIKIKNIQKNENISKEQKDFFVKSFVSIMKNCNIKANKRISNKNYNLWGKIKLSFN